MSGEIVDNAEPAGKITPEAATVEPVEIPVEVSPSLSLEDTPLDDCRNTNETHANKIIYDSSCDLPFEFRDEGTKLLISRSIDRIHYAGHTIRDPPNWT